MVRVLLLLSLSCSLGLGQVRLNHQQIDQFLNHGYRAGQVTRQQSKLKVDVLGRVLKKHVTKLRTGSGLETDLVFLVDSSASVGAENFYNEIKFIRKLLADFTVSQNTTRVVVITYSSVNQVIRQVDHMSYPNSDNHKCKLFEEEIPGITYNSGGTYTLGALLEAQAVFQFSRPSAKKAVFLITDGYSNGGDPRPAAEKLKELGVEFYTFGIRNGNVKELYDMASEPRTEHSFIVDSFEEFEALARRALHKDLGGSMYLVQGSSSCSRLCPRGRNCCDTSATCACGAHSGYYSCLCPRGHYGRGLQGDCHKCPAGTFKPHLEPGDQRSCLPCPGENQISPLGSYSRHQCRCKEGFQLKNGECRVMDCPSLQPPENGYFIRNECNNVFNAACGIRCNSGYQLSGSNIRLCLPSGTWSGETAVCRVKTCRPMQPPTNGYVSCSTHNYEVDTMCEFGCNFGFRLLGSRSRMCLPMSLWGGLPAYCKPIKCPRLRKPNYGDIYPPKCSTKKSSFGDQCAFACKRGFHLQGTSLRQCGGRGSWSGDKYMSRCVDMEPPAITCPRNITVDNDKNVFYALVRWSEPVSVDNSGFHPIVTSIPVVSSPMLFKIGTTDIKYFSEDLTGNKASCVFSVTVIDVQQPIVDFCESPPEFITSSADVDIEWDEPIFHDNSKDDLNITQTHPFGRFPFGDTEVVYTATDSSGNTAECKITVRLQRHSCTLPNDPINGHRNCSEDEYAVHCTLACQEGFAFAFRPTGDYFCQMDGPGSWMPEHNVMPFPDCSVSALSSVISIPTDLKLSMAPRGKKDRWRSPCDDTFFMKQVAAHVRQKVLSRLEDVCGDSLYCDVMDLEAVCGEVLEEREVWTNEIYRRKRDTGDFVESINGNSSQESEDRVFTGSVSLGPETGAERQVIEILFKLIGKYRHTITRKETQQIFIGDVDAVQGKIEDSAKSGSLNILLGKDLLEMEEIIFSPHDFLCDAGAIAQGNTCVNCPAGTYFNVVSRTCTPCTAGSYQPREAMDTCLVCPGGTFTKAGVAAAVNQDQCKAQCKPGTFSVDGLESCRTCQLGQYQSQYAQTHCQECAPGRSTLFRGVTSQDECLLRCPPGKTSDTGLEPCFPCPRGYFQHGAGADHCYKCPQHTTTRFQSSSSVHDCVGLHNPDQFTQFEVLAINDCFSLPCQNDAVCVALTIGFQCICQPGWRGSVCDIRHDPCHLQPCVNHGTCLRVGAEDYECVCEPGYEGKDCEIDIDECENNQCVNNATCVDLRRTDFDISSHSLSYYCECTDGFRGEYCEENIDDCANSGCEHGAQCIDGIGTFSCVCPMGFTGRLCEDEIDECASNPCHSGSTCVDGLNSYTCHCPRGMTGHHCEAWTDPCLSSPCHGNSVCRSEYDTFHCVCPQGYSGRTCNTQILPNFVLTFGNSVEGESQLDYVLLDGFRNSLDEFTICFWMSSEDTNNYGTPFSYATSTEDNELTITDYNGFVLSVAGEKVVTDVTATDGLWHFICVSWKSTDGVWEILRDGRLADRGRGLAVNKRINAGGLIVLGQEQDEKGGRFSAAESFQGRMTRLDVWGHALTLAEVAGLGRSCEPYFGNILAWSDVHNGLRGQIKISEVKFCSACNTLAVPVNGIIHVEGSGAQALGVFSCMEGYKLQGKRTVQCSIFGEWETDLPYCKLVNCGYPGYLHHGHISGSNFRFGDTVRNRCNPGYQLSGPEERTCLSTGQWSGQTPTCQEVTCPPIRTFLNGQAWVTNSPLPGESPANYSIPVGRRVTFTCDQGFIIEGSSSLQCEREGRLTGEVPVCQPLPCIAEPIVPNGYVAGGLPDVLEQGTILTYNCDPGYQVEVDTVECGPAATWSRPLPHCRPVICDSPRNVTNGKTSFGGRTYGQVAAYKCRKGHFLQGPHNSTCTEVGEWEPPPPVCTPVDCGIPHSLPNGSLDYHATTYKNVVKYSCDAGYILQGPKSRQCGSSGHWSKKQATCVPVTCSTPDSVPMATLEQAGPWAAGDMAVYVCQPGHQLISTVGLQCDPTGNWIGMAPHCIPRLCPGQGFIENGTLLIGSWTAESLSEDAIEILKERIEVKRKSSTHFRYHVLNEERQLSRDVVVFYPVGSELVVHCLPGFQLDGEATNVCEDTDRWRNPFPVCIQTFCPPLANIDNGLLTVQGFKFRQTVTYECELGFSLSGSFSRTCLENGTWSGEEPSCIPMICPEPPPVEQGVLGPVPSVEYGALASYSCLPGHTLLGGAERVCGHEGSWSGHPPICVNTSQSCLVPQLINSGYVAYDGSLEVGSQAWYDCSAQHDLVGPRERTCQEGGAWSGDTPKCRPRNCASITHLAHGSVLGRTFGLESSLQFSCRPGYRLEGADVITCGSDQEWSSPPPVCVPLICPELEDIEKGRVWGSARRFGDSVAYTCSEGYTLLGPRVRRCTGEGEWSGTNPHCAAIICPELEQLDHGVTQLDLRVPGEKARFHCDLGWRLQGNTNITCTNTGSWEGEIPVCIPATCHHPGQTQAILITTTEDQYEVGTRLSWICPERLVMVGSNSMSCLPTGTWDLEPPSCVRPECSQVVEVDNGVIFGLRNTTNGSEVRFSCDNGYYKVSSSQLSCSLGGRWEGTIPICSRHQCPASPSVPNATVSVEPLGDTYIEQYSCDSQYRLEGNFKRSCLEGGVWDNSQPTCVLAFCPAIPNIPKMLYTRGKVSLGQTIKFKCQPGYRISGETFIKCLHSGEWEAALPTCLPLTCPVRRQVRHGSWLLESGPYRRQLWAQGTLLPDTEDSVYVGDKLRTHCDPGFEVFGNAESECLVTESLDFPIAKCKATHCPRLQNIPHGSLMLASRYKGAVVTYQCISGYTIQGNNKRKCLRNKTWSGSVPRCEVVTCPSVHDMAHGEVELDGAAAEFGTILRYSCHLGYQLVGLSSRQCGSRGQWEGPEPECVQVRCTVPRIPLHGEQEVQGLTVGGTVTYSCTHGYKLQGAHLLTCLANTSWSHTVPSCHRIYCSQPTSLARGQVVAASLEYQAHALYSCHQGYSLVGPHTRSCLHTGLWSGPEPVCVSSMCPLVTVEHGRVISEDRTPGDLLHITCDPGYRLEGAGRLMCQLSLGWTPQPPTCVPVVCEDPTQVEHAVAKSEGRAYLDTVQYSCVEGYELRGTDTLVCSAEGGWSGSLPSCVPRPCGYLEAPPRTLVTFSSPDGYDLGYGSRAVFSCLPGFLASNVSVLTCTKEGVWRGEVFPCMEIPCGSPPVPEMGECQVTLQEDRYVAEYSCNPGYRLEGTTTLLCDEFSNWQFGMPSCQPLDCGPPPPVHHGQIIGDSHKFGDLVEVRCDPGFRQVKETPLVCTLDGNWETGGTECVAVTCPHLGAPVHGAVLHTTVQGLHLEEQSVPWEARANFSCQEGYQVVGAELAQCQGDGSWNHPVPQCQRKWCPPLESPPHTFMMGVSRQFGDVVRFACQQGYRLFGSQDLVCEAGGDWSGSVPACHRVWCDPPVLGVGQRLAQGQQLVSSPHRHVVKVECVEGFLVRGELDIVCRANGRWSRPEGACHRVSCGPPSTEPGVSLLSSTFLFGSKVPFVCPSGQYPVNSPLHCTAKGTWADGPARCNVIR